MLLPGPTFPLDQSWRIGRVTAVTLTPPPLALSFTEVWYSAADQEWQTVAGGVTGDVADWPGRHLTGCPVVGSLVRFRRTASPDAGFVFEIEPVQAGFPAVLTGPFDSSTGYPWKRQTLSLDSSPAVVDAGPAPTGVYAFEAAGRADLPAGTVVWLEPSPEWRGGAAGDPADPRSYLFRAGEPFLCRLTTNTSGGLAWNFVRLFVDSGVPGGLSDDGTETTGYPGHLAAYDLAGLAGGPRYYPAAAGDRCVAYPAWKSGYTHLYVLVPVPHTPREPFAMGPSGTRTATSQDVWADGQDPTTWSLPKTYLSTLEIYGPAWVGGSGYGVAWPGQSPVNWEYLPFQYANNWSIGASPPPVGATGFVPGYVMVGDQHWLGAKWSDSFGGSPNGFYANDAGSVVQNYIGVTTGGLWPSVAASFSGLVGALNYTGATWMVMVPGSGSPALEVAYTQANLFSIPPTPELGGLALSGLGKGTTTGPTGFGNVLADYGLVFYTGLFYGTGLDVGLITQNGGDANGGVSGTFP